MAESIRERIYKFDNIKFFTMMLVVVGHVIEPFINNSDMFKSMFIFIYTFHMPLFVFLSGLFQKRFSDTYKLKINKVAYYIALGYILKLIMTLTKSIGKGAVEFHFFNNYSIEWYLFALVMFMVTAYFVRNIKPAIVIGVSLVLGCTVGYFDFIADYFCLSRYFVYMPFYLAGYYLTPQTVMSFSKKLWVKIISGVSILIYFALCFRQLNFVYQLRRLFTGKNPFSTLPFDCSFQHRILCYTIATLMCMAVICFIPNIRIPLISNMGANTLGVYFWHNGFLFLLRRTTAFFGMIVALGDPLYKVVLLVFAVLVTILFSFEIFVVPLKALGNAINKLKPKWCYMIIATPFVLGAVYHYKAIIAILSKIYHKITG